MKTSLRVARRAELKKRASRTRRNRLFESLEPKTLLTATPVGLPSVSTQAELTTIFNTNSFMPVMATSHGTGSYGFPQWGFLEYGDGVGAGHASPSALFDSNNTGASDVNSVSFQLYNTATSGNFHPYDGSFSIYVIPDDSVNYNNVRFQTAAGTLGSAALGTASGDASTLGITGTASDWLVGTFSITSALQVGYSTFTGSTTGSTASGTGTSGSADVLGTAARAAIAADLNSHTPLRFAVVANDTGLAVDWEGNFSSNQPKLTLDINQAPNVYFDATSFATQTSAGLPITAGVAGVYSVTETDQVPTNFTDRVITVHRTGNPNVALDVDYHTSDGTAHAPADYTTATGTLHWDAGDTSDKTFTVHFKNITTTDPSRSINLTLTDHGGNAIAPVFPAGGATATATINYLQAVNVSFDSSSYTVNEDAGTLTFNITRSGSGVAGLATDVTYSTTDGVPYLDDPTAEQNALNGRDYTTTTSTVHFNAGETSKPITVPIPILNVKTFEGDRTFTVSLSSPSSGSALGAVAQSTVTIHDFAVTAPNGADVLTGDSTHSSGVENNGPFYVNSFMVLASLPHGSFTHSTMPVVTFGPGSAIYPTGYAVGSIDSLRLSIYNLATTGGFAGTSGSFDVYLLTDDSYDDSIMVYGGGTGATGSSVIGSQADPIFVGTAFFPNNQVGYNEFTLDNIPEAASNSIAADLNAHAPIRFAITPSAGSSVAADWEGNFTGSKPSLSLVVEKSPAVVESFLVDVENMVVDKTAGTATIRIDRTSSNGDLGDTATLHYTVSNGGNGLVGTPYNGAVALHDTDYTGDQSGTVNFGLNEDHALITVPLLNNVSIYGDKNFTVMIDTPSASDMSRIVNTIDTTTLVTIRDTRTTNIYQNDSDNATVQPGGPRTGGAGKTFFNVENAGAGTFASYGVIDYNHGYNGDLPFVVPDTIGVINQVSLSLVQGFPLASFRHSGLFKVYLVEDTTTDIQPGTSPLIFNTSLDSVEGLGNQLGTKHLLGTFSYDANQPIDVFTSFPLTDADSGALSLLKTALNTGATIRIVVTPGDNAVAASFEGQFSFHDLYEAPLLSVNYTPAPIGGSLDVINTDDSGAGSLRAALEFANMSPGTPDTITFHIPGAGVKQIQLLSALPALTDAVTFQIDTGVSIQVGAISPFTVDHYPSLTKTGAGALTIVGTQSYAVDTTMQVTEGALNLDSDAGSVGAHNLNLSASGLGTTVSFGASQHLKSVSVTGGAVVKLAAPAGAYTAPPFVSGTTYLHTKSLTIGAGSQLDLGNGALIIEGSTYNDVLAQLTTGNNGGSWDGPGIVSSVAAADASNQGVLTVGVLDNLTFGGKNGINGSQFNDQGSGDAVPADAVLVKTTYYGDANLDGLPTFDDFLLWDFGIQENQNNPGSYVGWEAGDFTYDSGGIPNFDDFLVWDFAFNYAVTNGVSILSTGGPSDPFAPAASVGSGNSGGLNPSAVSAFFRAAGSSEETRQGSHEFIDFSDEDDASDAANELAGAIVSGVETRLI